MMNTNKERMRTRKWIWTRRKKSKEADVKINGENGRERGLQEDKKRKIMNRRFFPPTPWGLNVCKQNAFIV
jgi:hypothetical protein